ncbi:MAG: metallophosphoesterase [Pseudomonadota bacterium]
MFRLAHISDIHLGPLPPVKRRELASKRITGYLNWQRNRKGAMADDTLERLVDHIHAAQPDHIAVTGDLINLALKEEIRIAAAWLARVGKPADVSVVPGNHDTYTPGALDSIVKAWAPYMAGDVPRIGPALPYLRQRGDVALIGVNSGRATLPFYATGSFRRTNARHTSTLLREAKEAGLFRVVMIHHPPFPNATARHKRLIGADRFRRVIAREGAELVLHGHTHIVSHEQIDGPNGPVPVIGVPSASASPVRSTGTHEGKRPAARYNVFEIERANDSWRCGMKEFGFATGEHEISLIAEREL